VTPVLSGIDTSISWREKLYEGLSGESFRLKKDILGISETSLQFRKLYGLGNKSPRHGNVRVGPSRLSAGTSQAKMDLSVDFAMISN
jgi:hypothetical protein